MVNLSNLRFDDRAPVYQQIAEYLKRQILLGTVQDGAPMPSRRELAAQRSRGVPGREDALRRLAQIAFGRANDCVRLVLEDDPPIGELDLTLLSEVKRSEKGAIEVRLADRIRALEELLQAGAADDGAAAAFFAAVEEP